MAMQGLGGGFGPTTGALGGGGGLAALLQLLGGGGSAGQMAPPDMGGGFSGLGRGQPQPGQPPVWGGGLPGPVNDPPPAGNPVWGGSLPGPVTGGVNPPSAGPTSAPPVDIGGGAGGPPFQKISFPQQAPMPSQGDPGKGFGPVAGPLGPPPMDPLGSGAGQAPPPGWGQTPPNSNAGDAIAQLIQSFNTQSSQNPADGRGPVGPPPSDPSIIQRSVGNASGFGQNQQNLQNQLSSPSLLQRSLQQRNEPQPSAQQQQPNMQALMQMLPQLLRARGIGQGLGSNLPFYTRNQPLSFGQPRTTRPFFTYGGQSAGARPGGQSAQQPQQQQQGPAPTAEPTTPWNPLGLPGGQNPNMKGNDARGGYIIDGTGQKYYLENGQWVKGGMTTPPQPYVYTPPGGAAQAAPQQQRGLGGGIGGGGGARRFTSAMEL